MKPKSIQAFDRLYLGALAVGAINNVLHWDVSRAALQAQPAMPFGPAFLAVTTAIGFLIPLLLWYFVSRRASTIAKWILVVLFVIGLIGFAVGIAGGAATAGGLAVMIGVIATALQAAAVWMLFRPDATAWFSGRGHHADIFR